MLKMNTWSTRWDLDEAQCPCDVHFNDWIADQEADRQVDLPFRHRHPSCRRPHPGGERLRQRRLRHHRLGRGIRFLHQAGQRERAGRAQLPRLFRRHLSDQPAAAAGVRRGDAVPPLRILGAQHGERRVRRPDRSRSADRCSPTGCGRAAMCCSTPGRSRSTPPRAPSRNGRRRARSSASASSRRCWSIGRQRRAAHCERSGACQRTRRVDLCDGRATALRGMPGH